MTSDDFDSDWPQIFKGTNYFFMAGNNATLYQAQRSWILGIMVNGPVVIYKFQDEYTKDDYKKIFKTFEVLPFYIVLSLLISMNILHIMIVLKRFGRLFITYTILIRMWPSAFVA